MSKPNPHADARRHSAGMTQIDLFILIPSRPREAAVPCIIEKEALMAAEKPAPAPAAAPAVLPARVPQLVPWWVPPWPVFLAAGLFAMTWWIMWTLAPTKGHDPSQLFNMLAQAIVLTAFIGGVVATVFTASRDSQKKNETIAAQAKVIATQATSTDA